GTFSMTTASSTYAGASVGGWIANALGLPAYPFQIIGGGVGATFGSIYTTSLKMSYTRIPAWVQEYQTFKGAQTWRLDEGGVWGEQGLKENFINRGRLGFGPGPLTRFANWLHNNPFARLPINGFMIADLGVRFLGWSPWAYPSLIAGDYLWQVKGKLGQIIWEKWLGPPIKDFAAKIYGKYIFPRWAQFAKFGLPGEAGLTFIDKPWLRGLKNIWSKAQPYLRNFFNPGFLMGFSLTPLLTPALGGWAYLVGPVLGSAGWLAATRITASVIGYSGAGVGAFLARFNALGWTGFMIGQLTGWLIFGWNVPFWYTAAWSVGLPLIGTVIQTLAWTAGFSTISAFLGTALSTITGGFISALGATSVIASGLAIWATVTSIALVAGLAIFSMFVIYSAFWVPMLAEWNAQPTSTNFSIQTDATQIAPNKYRLCAKFDITQNVLNTNNYLNLTMDFEDSQLTVNLSDPDKVTTASRDNTSLEYMFDWIDPNLAPGHYGLGFPADDPPIVGGFQPMPTLPAHLSTPSNQKGSIDELMETNPGLVSSIIPFLEILQEMAKDRLSSSTINWTTYFIQSQQELQNLLNRQKTVLGSLQQKVAAGELADAEQYLDSQLANNPVKDPEDISCSETDERCLEYKKTVKGYFDFWPSFINQKLGIINGLIAGADPATLAEAAALLEEEFAETEQMWENQKQLVKKLDKIKYQISKADSEILTDPNINIRNFANLPEDTKQKLWEILTNYFSEIFNLTTKYYYIPQGTSYTFCADADYCLNNFTDPPTPADCSPVRPQTVCSSIYAQTNIWIGTAFAKHCTTFTPQ
ncbi:hypothetical protein KKE48_05805, partial [Patescibacteria group bacterium]|nr:hypothetical protein [Patescibacteria group bacterium]